MSLSPIHSHRAARGGARTPVLILVAVGMSASLVLGRSSGALPGHNGIPLNATTGFPSCGACHGSGRPGDGGAVTVRFTGTASIRKALDASFGLAISSAVSGSRGGFALTTDRGALKPVGNTQADNGGRALSHTNSSSRTWSFKFASTQTGLHQWHAVGNTVNGDGRTRGDSWGWFGPNPGVPGAPFRVFVNDSQVFPYGTACAGTGGFKPLLGAAKNATRGQSFPVELYNAPPQSAAIGILGFSNKQYGAFPLPLPLDLFGAPGCQLNTSMDVLAPVPTTGSGPGNGRAVFPWFLPNLPVLRGVSLYFAALVGDATANRLRLTNTVGLRAVVQ